MADLTTKLTVTADADSAESALKRLSANVESLTSTLSEMGHTTAAFIAGSQLASFAESAAMGFADYERKLISVAVLSDDAKARISEFKSGILKLSTETGQPLDALTAGFYAANRSGVGAADMMGYLKTAADLSSVSALDMVTSVDTLSTVLNAYGIPASKATDVSDQLFASVREGKLSVGDLGRSLGVMATEMHNAGVSTAEMFAAVSVGSQTLGNTQKALIGVRSLIDSLTRGGGELSTVYQNLGYDSAQSAIENEGLAKVLQAVMNATGGTQTGLQRLLTDQNAVNMAMVLSRNGAQEYAAALAKVKDSAGEVAKANKEVDASAKEMFDKMAASAKVAATNIGEGLQTSFKGTVTAVKSALDAFNELDSGERAAVTQGAALAIGVGVATGAVLKFGPSVAKAAGYVSDLVISMRGMTAAEAAAASMYGYGAAVTAAGTATTVTSAAVAACIAEIVLLPVVVGAAIYAINEWFNATETARVAEENLAIAKATNTKKIREKVQAMAEEGAVHKSLASLVQLGIVSEEKAAAVKETAAQAALKNVAALKQEYDWRSKLLPAQKALDQSLQSSLASEFEKINLELKKNLETAGASAQLKAEAYADAAKKIKGIITDLTLAAETDPFKKLETEYQRDMDKYKGNATAKALIDTEYTNKKNELAAASAKVVEASAMETKTLALDAAQYDLNLQAEKLKKDAEANTLRLEDVKNYSEAYKAYVDARISYELDKEVAALAEKLKDAALSDEARIALAEDSAAKQELIIKKGADTYKSGMKTVEEAVAAAQKKQDDFWKSFELNAASIQKLNETAWTNIRDNIKSAIESGKLDLQSLLDVFKNIAAEMAANAITLNIAASLGFTSAGGGALGSITSAISGGSSSANGSTTTVIPTSFSGLSTTLFGDAAGGADTFQGLIGVGGDASIYGSAAGYAGVGAAGSYAGQYLAGQMGANQDITQGSSMLGGAAAGAAVGSVVPVVGTIAGAVLGGVIGYLSGPGFGGGVDNAPQTVYGTSALESQGSAGLAQIGGLFSSQSQSGNKEGAAFVLQSFDDINDRIIQTTGLTDHLDAQWQTVSDSYYAAGTAVQDYGLASDQANKALGDTITTTLDFAEAMTGAGQAGSEWTSAALQSAASLATELNPATEEGRAQMAALAAQSADLAIEIGLTGQASAQAATDAVSLATALNQDTVNVNSAISAFDTLINSLAVVDSRMSGLTEASNGLTLAQDILNNNTMFSAEQVQTASQAWSALTDIQAQQKDIQDQLQDPNLGIDKITELQTQYAALNESAKNYENVLANISGATGAAATDATTAATDTGAATETSGKQADAASKQFDGYTTSLGATASQADITTGKVSALNSALAALPSGVGVAITYSPPVASAASGEWFVPADDKPYNLHYGESVLTANDAATWRNAVSSGVWGAMKTGYLPTASGNPAQNSQTVNSSQTLSFTINAAPGQSAQEIADAVMKTIQRESERGARVISDKGIYRRPA
ncbi:MAG: phage tail tape measure protein [Nitrospinae bacterium]|nr:phage tail tape measure protein [Nitrospinota bacterium]